MTNNKHNEAKGAPVERGVNIGDYVLATKYNDGDPQDHWCVGFYSGLTAPHYDPPRYDVIDDKGNKFRGNGFRRIKKISAERGKWLLQNKHEIEQSGISLWTWFLRRMTAIRFCEKCGNVIQYRKRETPREYAKRKFCSLAHAASFNNNRLGYRKD